LVASAVGVASSGSLGSLGGVGGMFTISPGSPPPSPPAPTPTITSIAPTSGPVGTDVTITGTNFTGVDGISIGQGAPFTVVSPTVIRATVPAFARTAQTEVMLSFGGGHVQSGGFVFNGVIGRVFNVTPPTPSPPAPSVTSITPTSGPVGTTVTITGTNFTGATEVRVGFTTQPAAFTLVSPSTLTAIVPAGTPAGQGGIRITTPSGTTLSGGPTFSPLFSLPNTFDVTGAPPPPPPPPPP